MDSDEVKRIDKITETVFDLTKGRIPGVISVENEDNDEIAQLSGMVNNLIDMFKEVKDTVTPLAKGNLEVEIPRNNLLVSPFKQLKSSLMHLTWQTQQIAAGDYKQRVDFMGKFSDAFNSMVNSLDESRKQLFLEVDKNKNFAEAQSKYLNVMAHDIRTPLGAVVGFLDILLSNKSLDSEAVENVKVIMRNCNSLMVLINNMLEQAKLDNKKIEINSISFSLYNLLNDIETMIQPKLNIGVRYKTILDDRIPSKLIGDPHRLKQVLTNLISNAAKFTEEGFVSIEVTLKEKNKQFNDICFAVKDTGIGISSDKISTVFNAFTQADINISANFGGTGLGLYIAKELVDLMKGKLDVTSTLNEGTLFYFTIPLKKCDIELELDNETDVAYSPKTKILFVDDDIDSLEIYKKIFSELSLCVETCSNSTKTYKMIQDAKNEKKPFTLLSLDLKMPFGGIALAKLIRRDLTLKNLKIAALTSYPKVSYDDSYLFDFIFKKPMTHDIARKLAHEASLAVSDFSDNTDVLDGLRILLVDDCLINRMLINKMFEKYDVLLSEAENGVIGVNCILNQKYDIVLMDYQMPEMDGLNAIKEVRKKIDSKSLPIFAFTADDSEETRSDFIDAGANDIIPKPVKLNDFIRKLKKCKTRYYNV